MKRFVYAAAAMVLTGMLVLFAMAVAQRDARVSNESAVESQLPYANQPAQPISGATSDAFSGSAEWPPAPLVRGNDSGLPGSFVSSDDVPRASARASLTSYAEPHSVEFPENATTPAQKGRLAEPPPLMNKFLTPSTSSSNFNSSSTGQPPSGLRANPSSNLLDTLPTAPSSLPNAPSSLPSNLPNSLSTTLPGTLPTLGTQIGIDAQTLPSGNEAYTPSVLPSSPSPANFGTPFSQLPNDVPAPYTPTQSSAATSSPTPYSPPSLQDQTPVATLGMPMATNPPTPFRSSNNDSALGSAAISDKSAGYAVNSPLASTATAVPNGVGFASAAPGVRQLDGAQNPSMEIQKRAPNEVQVGVPATFTVLVRNVGNASAFDVNVVDAVPKGARLLRTNPQAQQNGANGLTWKLGEMAAGAEQTITIELVPESEGEIGSVASVNFAAQASVRTISTQPKLVVKQLLESTVLGGENLKIMIEVSNLGTGTARNVRLEEDVPQNMRHASGAQVLGLPVGDLSPGESQKYSIDLTAVSAGKVSNLLRAIADNATSNESAASIEVVAPKLQITMDGPKLRYLERQATYTASITNTGTAIATNVDLIVYLPSGLQFNSAENRGEYVPNQHAVMWQLAELASGQTASTKVTLLPVEEGEFVLRTQSSADSVRAEPIEKPVRVEGQSELAFSIEDDNDPIETDGKTTYIIKIVNMGTRVDNDVQLQIDLPEGAVVEQVDAPGSYQVGQRGIQFSPIAQMKSKEQQTIRVAVRHTREGTHVLRAQLKSKLRPGAVIKEESTQVYRDQ